MNVAARLTEIPAPPQVPGALVRRWFTSESLDLIVWLDEGATVQAFQLCYGKPLREHALEWRQDSGYCHLKVDDGSSTDLGHKRTPVMHSMGIGNAAAPLQQLESVRSHLPEAIFSFVRERLLELRGDADE
ncbi:MAG: hypothetical protein K0S46_150 [Moraxellaceae bacterium]|jgi:hypothetical protein|nr:hypothetical protein [Moraxellaceae bacterium]